MSRLRSAPASPGRTVRRDWRSTPARSAPPSCCRRPRACSTTTGCRNASASSARPRAIPWRGAELDASNWRRADEAHWRILWEQEIAELPTHRESRFWLAAGLLLPVWDRLPAENMRVRRLTTDPRIRSGAGSRIGGACPGLRAGRTGCRRVIDRARARRRAGRRRAHRLPTGRRHRHDRRGSLRGGHGPGLGTRPCQWLAPRPAAHHGRRPGRDRGPADTDTALLKRIGCTVEIVSWRARAFAPGAEVLDRVLERWPLAA